MATVGAIYCYETSKAVAMFQASKAIAIERIRQSKEIAHQALLSDTTDQLRLYNVDIFEDRVKTTQIAQTLLILLATANWGDPRSFFKEALGIHGTLAAFIRENCLLDVQPLNDSSWGEWSLWEGTKRTIFLTFCFFNFHMILCNTPPGILNQELHFSLPCTEKEWSCSTLVEWQSIHTSSGAQLNFQRALSDLLSCTNDTDHIPHSSLGSYVLVLALIQHIFSLRQLGQYKAGSDGHLSPNDLQNLMKALQNWQCGWEKNPEGSLDPQDPSGPVAFNSTALTSDSLYTNQPRYRLRPRAG